MVKKQDKPEKKCCGKYLKTGRHCKGCPLLKREGAEGKAKKTKNKDRAKKGKKKK